MDGNRKKPDGRLQFQKERFFSRFCALQVLFQQEFQPEIEWDAKRWSYYLCMMSGPKIRYHLRTTLPYHFTVKYLSGTETRVLPM